MKNAAINNAGNDYLYFALLLFGHIILIWILPYFPTQDGPSHMYNLVILNDLVHGGKDWVNYYTINYRLIPNLGFHVIAFPLLQIWSPIVTEKVFITLYVILLGSGYLYFLHAFEKPKFPHAYFVLPVIFNFTLLMGNYSYTIAIPVYIIGLALQWKFRNASIPAKFIIINFFAVTLFLFHLIPFCLYIISASLILWIGSEKKLTVKYYLKQLILFLPCILVLILYLWNTSDIYQLSQILQKDQIASGSVENFLTRKIFLICELILFSTDTFSRWQLVPAAIFGFLVVCFSYESLKQLINKFINRGKLSPANNFFFIQNIILIGIYLLAPFRWGSGSFFNERLPWVILLFLIPVLTIPKARLNKKIRPIVIMIVIFFLAVNTIVFNNESKKVQDFIAGLKIDMPKGSFLMTYKKPVDAWARVPVDPWARVPVDAWARVDTIRHAGSYYGIKNKAIDVGNYQANTKFFLVEFNRTIPKLPQYLQVENNPHTINFSHYPSIQYILGHDLSEFDKKNLGNYFKIIFENNDLSIWRRKN